MMTKGIAIDSCKKLWFVAVALMAVAGPFAFGQGDAAPKTQAPAAQSVTPIPQWQMAAGGKMTFEVASIRPSKPDTFTPPNFALSSDDSHISTGGIFTADFPVATYIEFAYKLNPDQGKLMRTSLPKWATTDAFEIHARSENQNPTKDQMRLMMQSLLADRFKLAFHFETQQVPVLALTLIKPGKTGPKLRPHADGPPCDAPAPPPASDRSEKIPGVYPARCDEYDMEVTPGHLVLLGSRNTTMDLLAHSLNNIGRLGRPVVDRTELNGRFDFTMEWTPESNRHANADADAQPDSQGTTFLEAVKEQLGLKLESTKATMDILVIDHVERPSDN
jgi:bla regulator protein blaR1